MNGLGERAIWRVAHLTAQILIVIRILDRIVECGHDRVQIVRIIALSGLGLGRSIEVLLVRKRRQIDVARMREFDDWLWIGLANSTQERNRRVYLVQMFAIMRGAHLLATTMSRSEIDVLQMQGLIDSRVNLLGYVAVLAHVNAIITQREILYDQRDAHVLSALFVKDRVIIRDAESCLIAQKFGKIMAIVNQIDALVVLAKLGHLDNSHLVSKRWMLNRTSEIEYVIDFEVVSWHGIAMRRGKYASILYDVKRELRYFLSRSILSLLTFKTLQIFETANVIVK